MLTLSSPVKEMTGISVSSTVTSLDTVLAAFPLESVTSKSTVYVPNTEVFTLFVTTISSEISKS